MIREEWLKQLEKNLRKLPKREREDAMEFYYEYFDEAGAENEAEILKDIGEPKKAAKEIIARYSVTQLEEDGILSKAKWIWLSIVRQISSISLKTPITWLLILMALLGACFVVGMIFIIAACILGGMGVSVVAIFYGIKAFEAGYTMGMLIGVGSGIAGIALMVLAGYGVIVLLRVFIKFVIRKIKESNENMKAERAMKKAMKGGYGNEESY